MRRKLAQLSPSRLLRTTDAPNRRSVVRLKALSASLRHYFWARSIAERFLLRKRWPALASGELIYLRQRWNLNLTRNMFITQTGARFRDSRRTGQHAPAVVSTPRYSAGSNKSASSSSAGAVFRSELTRPLFQPAVVSRSAVGGHLSCSVMRQRSTWHSRATGMTVVLPDRGGRLVRPRQNGAEHELATQTVVTRVREKHRRVEEHRALYIRTLRSQTVQADVSSSDLTVAAEARAKHRQSRPLAAVDADLQRPGRTAPPVIDSARLTDEVLKQLDRRLVAARERMGRV